MSPRLRARLMEARVVDNRETVRWPEVWRTKAETHAAWLAALGSLYGPRAAARAARLRAEGLARKGNKS